MFDVNRLESFIRSFPLATESQSCFITLINNASVILLLIKQNIRRCTSVTHTVNNPDKLVLFIAARAC